VLELAAKGRGNLSIIQDALSKGASVRLKNTTKMSILKDAVENNTFEEINILLEEYQKLNTPVRKYETALTSAIKKNMLSTVDLFIRKGSVYINDYLWPEHILLRNARTFEMVKLLIEAGADVNFPRTAGFYFTPLQHAVIFRQLDVMQLLIDSDADVEAKNAIGSALHVAILYPDLEVIKLLIDSGANVDSRQASWTPPLADYKYKGFKNTILHILVIEIANDLKKHPERIKKILEVIDLVLDAGANKNLKAKAAWSNDLTTPYELAKSKKLPDYILNILAP
jgi:ankyrin repeat protein